MRSRIAALLLAATVVLSGCGRSGVAPTIADIGLVDIGTAAADRSDPDVGPIPAAELRLLLEQQLALHVVLTAEVLRVTADGSAELQAAADALADNTLQLRGAVAIAYGDVGGTAFANLWVEHVRSFAVYAQGLAARDNGLRDTALTELADYERDFASFCQIATGDRLPAAAVEDLLSTHVEGLVAQADEWAAGDHLDALLTTRVAVSHMTVIGDALAAAIADQHPDRFPGPPDDPLTDQRSALAAALTDLVVLRAVHDRARGEAAHRPTAEALEISAVAARHVVSETTVGLVTPPRQIVGVIDRLADPSLEPGSTDIEAALARHAVAWTSMAATTGYTELTAAVGAILPLLSPRD